MLRAKSTLFALIAFGFIGLVALFVVDDIVPSAARRALPDSADSVREYYSDAWINPDFVRLVKAELPSEDYPRFATALGLTQRFDPVIHGDMRSTLEMGIGDAPEWWDPPSATTTTYFDHVEGGEFVEVLRYNNGTVYYLVSSW